MGSETIMNMTLRRQKTKIKENLPIQSKHANQLPNVDGLFLMHNLKKALTESTLTGGIEVIESGTLRKSMVAGAVQTETEGKFRRNKEVFQNVERILKTMTKRRLIFFDTCRYKQNKQTDIRLHLKT